MAWELTAVTMVGIGAAILSGVIATVAWRHRTDRAALPFLALFINLATWSLIYGIQLGFETFAAQLLWQRFTLGVAGFVPISWLVFTIHYTGLAPWLTRRRAVVLLAEPVAFFGFCLTNPVHHLVWTEAVPTTVLDVLVPALSFGPVYVLHIVFAYGAVLAGIVLLLRLGFHISSIYQKQVALLVGGALPPFLSHVSFSLGLSPLPRLDLTPFAFAFTGVVLGLALFRFNLLTLAPVAREKSFTETGDGLVVVDADGTVADVLGVADEVFEPAPTVGEPVTGVLPDGQLDEIDGTNRTVDVGNQRRTYQLQVSSLSGREELPAGHMILVRDITDLQKSEQRLEVSNRVLRHNLRNDMAIVLGYARELETRLSGQDAADVKQIRETAEGLIGLSEKARKISKLDEYGGDDLSGIDVAGQLDSILAEFRAEYPEVTVTVDVSEAASVCVPDPDTFTMAIRNVLENAAEHNDTDDPQVTIDVRSLGDDTRIEVSDNGPGLPTVEQRVLVSETETPLLHSQGLGLWLTYWCVTLSDGELTFETDEAGTTVALDFPQGDSSPVATYSSFSVLLAVGGRRCRVCVQSVTEPSDLRAGLGRSRRG